MQLFAQVTTPWGHLVLCPLCAYSVLSDAGILLKGNIFSEKGNRLLHLVAMPQGCLHVSFRQNSGSLLIFTGACGCMDCYPPLNIGVCPHASDTSHADGAPHSVIKTSSSLTTWIQYILQRGCNYLHYNPLFMFMIMITNTSLHYKAQQQIFFVQVK